MIAIERMFPGDPRWPRGLDDLSLSDRPSSLFLRGIWPIGRPWIAVVGTRRADRSALDFAQGFARDLARAGCVVVSGGARGVDTAAHRGALAGGGATIVVIANGLGAPYPPENRPFFSELVDRGQGALVSEVPGSVPPASSRFIARNRLIAAVASAVVVIQAPARSGALSTARVARSLNRKVFVVPNAPWEGEWSGGLDLLRRGAAVCTRVEDVISVRALRDRSPRDPTEVLVEKHINIQQFDDESATILRILVGTRRHIDDVVAQTGLPVSRVHQLVLRLVLDGCVIDEGDHLYSVSSSLGSGL